MRVLGYDPSQFPPNPDWIGTVTRASRAATAWARGPVPEVRIGERDAKGQSPYDRTWAYDRENEGTAYDESLFYDAAADRLAAKFVGFVSKEFQEHGVILEKCDLVQRESDVSPGIEYDYDENLVGVGWTNTVVLRLLVGVER